MRVKHAAACADQLACTACGLAFELEMEGARLFVTQWPAALPFLHIVVPDDWRTASELRDLVKQMTSSADQTAPAPAATRQPAPASAPANAETASGIPDSAKPAPQPAVPAPQSAPPPLNADAIGIRIKQLRALGNSPKEIRTTLTQTERDPERVQAILAIIAQSDRQEQSRQRNKLAWSLGILMLVVIVLVVAGYIFQENFLNQNQTTVSAAEATAGTTVPRLQPTPVPPNLAVKFLNLNTPVVRYGAVPTGASGNGAGPGTSSGKGAGASACPRSAQQAADLFGGRPADWYYPTGSNGWVMARAGGASVTISIPKGMKAAYLQLSNKLDLIEVQGPASLSDAYYVAISCP